MARQLRIEFENAIYHVCARGNARHAIFLSDMDRARLLELLGACARRFEVDIIAFVLMSNHFHLIVQTRRANLARWMHWLLTSYTVFFNKRHARSGHLFQGRYKSFLVEAGEYLLELSRYIHLNPVRGLRLGQGDPSLRRERLRKFKWSSYRGYAGLAKPFEFVRSNLVLGELGSANDRAELLRYRRFVEEGLLREIENPFEQVQWQSILAGENLFGRVRDHVRTISHKNRELPPLRELARPQLESQTILNRVAKKYAIDKNRLLSRDGHGLKARNVAMWVIWESGDKTLAEIGRMFGGLDYAAVGQRIRRVRGSHSAREARQLIDEMLNVKT